jgi:hypothetical protein
MGKDRSVAPSLQTTTTCPTTDGGPQPYKVEAKKSKRKNNKSVNKYEEAQLQLQDLNSAKLNQTKISSIHQTNEKASTIQPRMLMKNNIVQIYYRQDCIKKSEEYM